MVEKFRFNAGDAVVWHNLLAKYECTIGMIIYNPTDGTYTYPPETGLGFHNSGEKMGTFTAAADELELRFQMPQIPTGADSVYCWLDNIYLEEVVVYESGGSVNGGGYRYGFNGQEKSTEINGSENFYTAEFWQYDGRLGRRWNVDPKPVTGVSPYVSFLNSPILFNDPFGDTIKVYGNAEITNTTLRQKGGWNERGGTGPGGSYMFKDAKINPVYAKDNSTLIGYNIYDSKNNKRTNPILQVENDAELANFKENYTWQFGGARLYYANGEPSEGFKKMSAGLGVGNFGMVWQGVAQENRAAWSNPVFVAQMVLSFAHVGTTIGDRSSLILPNRNQNGVIKFTYNGVSNSTGGRSGGNAPLLGKLNTYTITRGGHIIFYEANGRALWDVSKKRIKSWEWNNSFPKDGGYITKDVPEVLKSIIDASKR